MVLEFMTKRNVNGHRNYLKVAIDRGVFTRQCNSMIMDGIEIKSADYKRLLEMCEGRLTEVDHFNGGMI